MSELLNYKCPACAGRLEFDSVSQKLKCPFCGSEYNVTEFQQENEAENGQMPDFSGQTDEFRWGTTPGQEWGQDEDNGMSVFVCKSCGGEIVGDENTAATACPYCGNPIVMSGRLSGMLKPDFVIPFKLDKKAAKEKLKKYVSSKKYTPNTFKSENRLDEIRGIYVPVWLFDSDIHANAQYEGTKVRTWKDNRFEYKETTYFDIYRQGTMSFANIPVDGSTKIPTELLESIEPFEFQEAVSFQTAYLAGYLADKYDITMEQSIARANERIKNSAREQLKSTVKGYQTVTPKFDNVQLLNGVGKYALYPVWLLNTTYKGEKYTFAMNGQTGKFVGNLPVDQGKIRGLFIGVTIGVAAIVLVIGKLLGMY